MFKQKCVYNFVYQIADYINFFASFYEQIEQKLTYEIKCIIFTRINL